MAGIQMSAGFRMKTEVERILKAHGFLNEFEKSTEFHLAVLNEPWMKLVIERHGDDVSVAHTYQQNGDVMRDPEIVFRLPLWEAVEITQDPVGRYRAKYGWQDGQQTVNLGFDRMVGELVRVWARNLKEQGYSDKSAKTNSLTHPKVGSVEQLWVH